MLWLSCGDLSWRELSSVAKYLTADSRKVTSKKWSNLKEIVQNNIGTCFYTFMEAVSLQGNFFFNMILKHDITSNPSKTGIVTVAFGSLEILIFVQK